MIKKWQLLGVQEKLHILIQGTLIILFVISVQWLTGRFEKQITNSAKARAMETADGLINGMNMLMLTGTISNPDNRKLLLKKMSQSKGIRELRIIRAKQVQDQFGPGLPSEQPVDNIDRKVIRTGKMEFVPQQGKNGAPMLRVVVPFIAQTNFRGTNCLNCHHVEDGSVNGAASVLVDLSEEAASISTTKKWLWLWFVAVQALLSVIIAMFVRRVIVKNITKPVKHLQETMSAIQRDGDLTRQAAVDENNADIGEMAKTFNTLTESLLAANKRLDLFAQVFENSGEAIVITDADRNIIAVNPAFTAITRYKAEDVTGKNPKLLSSGRQSPEFYQEMWKSINETGRWRGEIWNRRENGEIYPEWLSIGTVKDENGKVVNFIGIFNDTTQRKEAEQHIQYLAHYDSLTNLPNRRLFEDRIQQGLLASKRARKKAALLFLDLDRFKSINDSLGHLSGDQLLQSVAERLKSCVRESDTVCRQGGDEFLILLPEINKSDDAAHVANKIITSMAEAHFVEDFHLIVTFSIGISIYPDDGTDSQTLIRNADAAMYHAKENGRNNFQFFTPDMNAEALERLELEADLRQAIQQNELSLNYQPQIDNMSGKIVGIEALIRWKHPEKGMISPARFIPIAEDCGLIAKIGEWVLRTACTQNRRWQDENLIRVPIAVNLSALQFYQRDIRDCIAQVLQQSGLEPRYLELEITESTAMRDIEATVHTLNELKQMGILISIDDFGTGYSSLSYLKRFPIDKLKIDQSFVRDINTDVDDAAIVQTIIGMGHSLRLTVIAEGVETMDQLTFLKYKGCDEVQGYYFSKPLPAEGFAKYVSKHTVEKGANHLPWMMLYDSVPVALSEVHRQHQELMGMVDRLEQYFGKDAPAETISKMMDELIVHTQMHFAAEEWLMGLCDYPEEKSHRREHAELLEDVVRIRGEMGGKANPRLLETIRSWLINHIRDADQSLSLHISASEVK